MELEKAPITTQGFPNLASYKFDLVKESRRLEVSGGYITVFGERVCPDEMLVEALKESISTTSIVSEELERAGIPVVYNPELGGGGVPTYVTGKLTRDGETLFSFKRAWYYWVVVGPTPIEIAGQLYQDPVGRKDVRVDGYAGCCPPPIEWVTYFDQDGKKILIDPDNSEYNSFKNLGLDTDGYRFVADLSEVPEARGVISSYHIDSVEGLALFVNTLRESGVVD
jgi:hypothetical protein